MTLEADILDDCDIFDGVMTGTLTLLDGTTQSVSRVTRSKLTAKQTAQMGIIGVDDEIENFSLPVQYLNSKVPRQDCFWTDSNSVKWKILSVERRTLSSRYLCMCVRSREEYVAATDMSDNQLVSAWSIFWNPVSGSTDNLDQSWGGFPST